MKLETDLVSTDWPLVRTYAFFDSVHLGSKRHAPERRAELISKSYGKRQVDM